MLVIACLPANTMQADLINTGALIREMIDMHRLTTYPDPAFKTIQFSSYDHRSALPGGPDWFANSDGFGNEPIPNFEETLRKPGKDGSGEYLICDVNGPGAVVRVWTAAIEGLITMVLDDAPQPVFAGSAQNFFSNPYQTIAKTNEINIPDLTDAFQQRNAGYFPIPFEKRCRIVWTGDVEKIHFYQIQMRLFESDAEVTTFQPADLKNYQKEIHEINKILLHPNQEWKYSDSAVKLPINVSVAADETKEALVIKGSKAIENLTLKVSADDVNKALRQTILHIIFDEYPWGQVQCPIGDFFGAAPGINPFDSVPFTVHADGTMTCRYVMPFAKSAKILIDNRGDQPVSVTGFARPIEHHWQDDASMHFRARWRINHDLVASNRAVQDMPYLIANGKGVFVGAAVMLLNPNPIPTPYGSWWGEGDEKIFVDDDFRPSTFGTGSEDYFNYAWSSPDIFGHPYCGQPRNDGPGNRGFVANHRWHILDPLPFQSRIAFYMELFSHERTPGVSYARIAYHYARPGLMDDHLAITNEDVRHLELPANWMPAARMGASNSVFFQTEELVQGNPKLSFDQNNLWSGGKAMIWHPASSIDKLNLELPVAEDGTYTIHFSMVRNNKSGHVTLQVNQKQTDFEEGNTINLYTPDRMLNRLFSTKEIKLKKGKQTVTVQSVNASADIDGKIIGIDFVMLQKR